MHNAVVFHFSFTTTRQTAVGGTLTGGKDPAAHHSLRGFSAEIYSPKNITTMKELIEILLKDIKDENFSKREYVIYGIVTSLVLVGIIALVGWLETM